MTSVANGVLPVHIPPPPSSHDDNRARMRPSNKHRECHPWSCHSRPASKALKGSNPRNSSWQPTPTNAMTPETMLAMQQRSNKVLHALSHPGISKPASQPISNQPHYWGEGGSLIRPACVFGHVAPWHWGVTTVISGFITLIFSPLVD